MNPLQIIYSVVGTVLTVALLGIAWHCYTVTQEYKTFREGVAAAGKKAKDAADQKEADDKAAKEKADAQTQADRARIAALARELHNARSNRSFLPAPSALATSVSVACFDRAEFERATRRLDEGLSRLAEVCDQRTVDLNAAKAWATR